MTAGQIWDEDPRLADAYREAAEYHAQCNFWDMWLQGVFFFISVSTALGNAFRKKGAKPVNYMEQPIRILPLSEEEKEAKAEQERQKTIAFLNRFTKKWEETH